MAGRARRDGPERARTASTSISRSARRIEERGELRSRLRPLCRGQSAPRARRSPTTPSEIDDASSTLEQRLFTPDFFAARAGQGCAAPDPIFILGMPRAGSTLIEQILASHRRGRRHDGAARHPGAGQAARRAASRGATATRLSRMPRRPRRRRRCARSARNISSAPASSARPTGPIFIDKMPNNWAHVGLIRLILPNAKIIDARRHPLDCCFSNFKQHYRPRPGLQLRARRHRPLLCATMSS